MGAFKRARSDARQALADSIEALAAAEQGLVDAKANVGRSMRMADESEAKLASATQELGDAKSALASAMSAPTTSSATLRVRDGAVRQARSDEQAAADHVEATREALGLAQRAAIAAQRALDAAKIEVSNAAKRVIKDEAKTRTIARAQAIRAELDAKTRELLAALNEQLAVLRFFGSKDCEEWNPGNFSTTDEDQVMWDIIKREERIFDGAIQTPVRTAWAAYLSELHSNPDAPSPHN